MLELVGDLWRVKADAKCITTNGFVKLDGRAVMGRGVALQATGRYPNIARSLGQLLKDEGNHVHHLGWSSRDGRLYSFPVKHHWREKADLELIERSARELVEIVDKNPFLLKVLIPKPGCGNGQLLWEDVKPVIADILNDRFIIIDRE